MRVERVPWRISVAASALLLFAPATPRTSWSYDRGGGMTHSAGWDWIALMSGVVALICLIVGRFFRPSVLISALAALLASVALAISAAASLGHWLDLMSGNLELARWTIRPAPAVAPFAAIAAAGMAASLVLLGTWLRPDEFD